MRKIPKNSMNKAKTSAITGMSPHGFNGGLVRSTSYILVTSDVTIFSEKNDDYPGHQFSQGFPRAII